jgi:hypothetical protein
MNIFSIYSPIHHYHRDILLRVGVLHAPGQSLCILSIVPFVVGGPLFSGFRGLNHSSPGFRLGNITLHKPLEQAGPSAVRFVTKWVLFSREWM